MGETTWFLSVTALLVVLLGGGFLVSMFSWFARHEGEVKLVRRRGTTLDMLLPVAGLVILAGLLAGILRLLRPYMH